MSSLAAAVAAASAAASNWASRLSRILSSSTPTAKPPKFNPKAKRARTPTPKPPAADADSIADLGAQAAAKSASDADHKLPKPLGGINKALVRERDPDKLVSKFVQASSASSLFRDRHRPYEVAVSRLTSLGRQDGIEAIIDAQKPFLETSTEGFATRLIRLYGGASMPSHAAATFHQLPARHKSTRTFNAVLAAYAQAGDLDALTAVFKEIPASHPSIVPSVYSYNVLIRTLYQKSDLSAALDAVRLMEERGVSPDIITFNSLLNGFLNCDRNDEAEKVWGMIKERNLELDAKCYNARLRGLVAQGRIDDAAAVLEMLEKDGPKPNIVSYNELIRGYCKAGRFQEANKVYDNLMKNECVPNKGTYETLVPYLLQAGELDCALRYCYEIFDSKRCCGVEYGVLQDVVNALVDALRVEEATKLADLMWTKYNCQKSLRMPPSAEMMRKNQYQMKRNVKVEDETEK